jgi:hypothetical protein
MVKHLYTDTLTGRGVEAELYEGKEPKQITKTVDEQEIVFQVNPGEYLVDYKDGQGQFPYNGPHFHEQFRSVHPVKTPADPEQERGLVGGVPGDQTVEGQIRKLAGELSTASAKEVKSIAKKLIDVVETK